MTPDEPSVEAWVEEQVLAWLARERGSVPVTIETFVASRPAAPGIAERARDVLLERLRIVARFEGEVDGTNAPELGPGARVDDFEIVSVLGRGGMGQVFRARQRSLGRDVAIKVPHWGHALDPQARLRFLREAQAIAQLRHPGIVKLHQVGEHAGSPYLVLELVDGRTLAAILRDVAEGRLPRAAASLGRADRSWEEAACAVVIDALDAVAAAHELGIVHRDLKPANILIEPEGRVRILDFGLARLAGGAPITATHEPVGTVGYLAPETVRNSQAVGPWSDIYALGVTLYEMIALARPFEAGSPAATMARIEAGDARPLHVGRRAPRRLSAVVERAMGREIGGRYASAREFQADLRAYLDGGEIRARPSTVVSRLGRRMQRSPSLTVTGVLLVVALAMFAGEWRNARVANASIDRVRASERTRAAYLWSFADVDVGGRPSDGEGADRAILELEEALKLDPASTLALVELARLHLRRSEPHRAGEQLHRLRESGARDRSIDWLEAWQQDSDRHGMHPEPGETFDGDDASNLDRLSWARHLLGAGKVEMDRAVEILRPVESDAVLGPVANYLQFEACNTRGVRDRSRAARYLQTALSAAPGHPGVIANLAMVLTEQYRIEHGRPNTGAVESREMALLRGDLMALLPAFAVSENEMPGKVHTWSTHAGLLRTLGFHEEARGVLLRGLTHRVDDPYLADALANAYLDRWAEYLDGTNVPPSDEFDHIYTLLDRVIDRADALPINVVNIVKVAYSADRPDLCCAWLERLESALPALNESTRAQLKPFTDVLPGWCDRSSVTDRDAGMAKPK